MLLDIQKNGGVEKIGEFITAVKDKNSNVRLMGFGHRVYKNYDPRAKLMRETYKEVLGELGLQNDPLFKLANGASDRSVDDYFVSQALPGTWISTRGIVQRAFRHSDGTFHGNFLSLARTVGWIAQLNEMLADPDQKIGRPPGCPWA